MKSDFSSFISSFFSSRFASVVRFFSTSIASFGSFSFSNKSLHTSTKDSNGDAGGSCSV
jgi:hypothetical protein